MQSNQTVGEVSEKWCVNGRNNLCTVYFLVLQEAIYSDKGSVNTVRWQTVALPKCWAVLKYKFEIFHLSNIEIVPFEPN